MKEDGLFNEADMVEGRRYALALDVVTEAEYEGKIYGQGVFWTGKCHVTVPLNRVMRELPTESAV